MKSRTSRNFVTLIKKSNHNKVEKRSRAIRKSLMDLISSQYSKKSIRKLTPYQCASASKSNNITRSLNEDETIVDLLSKSKLLSNAFSNFEDSEIENEIKIIQQLSSNLINFY